MAQAEPGEVKTDKRAEDERGKMEDTEKDERCGLGPCHPRGIQGYAKLILFTLTLSVSGMFTIMQGPLFVSQVTSIERQFEMNSTQIGALMSANDIGFLLLVLLISHFAKDTHAPRMMGAFSIVFAVAAILIALLNFAHPRSLPTNFQSSANNNLTSGQNDKYLCVPNLTNRTFDEGCNSENMPVGNVPLVVVFGLFLALQGVSKAMRSPLGVTYIDNNVSHRSQSGFHIGLLLTTILFGPPIGFAFGGAISQIYVDLSDTSMTTADPRWVSAWWIGFLVVGALVFLSSLPMLFFPRRMPGRRHGDNDDIDNDDAGQDEKAVGETPCILTGEDENPETAKSRDLSTTQTDGKDHMYPELHFDANPQPVKTVSEKEVNGDAPTLKSVTENDEKKLTLLEILRELPRSLLRLLKDPVYVILVFGLAAHIFAVVGYSSFLIKFVERQFGLPPHLSSYIFGLSNLVFSGFGTFIGGVLVTRGNLTRRGCLRWVVFAGTVSMVLSAVTMGLGCDSDPIVGLGHSEPFVLDDGLTTCECDVTQILPVCDGNQTFLSPCHAGCTRSVNTTHFADCSLAGAREAEVGFCSPGCYLLIPFIVVQVLSSAISSTTITPCYVTILRTMSEHDKTLGLGLLSFTMSLVGFMPGPIVYGAVIDQACLIWSSSCGKTGACALYDVTRLRHNYIGVEVGGKAVALLLLALALLVLMWQIRTDRTKDEEQVQEKYEEGDTESKRNKRPKVFEMMRF
ncbi:solute carrier organic anion transporter family member 2B1-like [Littorina saxatilis]|uniref:Solute carrier organic anion transporter family member n=1 Tax=Littorina saxatilis TaxID=31220 RepID=A0AAN9C2G2_9CAEN